MTFRQKWENYWYHYKALTFGVAFAVVLVVIFIGSFVTKKEPDMYMVYISDGIIADDNVDRFKADIEKEGIIKDTNGDDAVLIYFEQIFATFDVNNPVDETSTSKLQTIFDGGQHQLMLVHKYALEDYDGIFEDLAPKVQQGDATFVSPSENFVTGISVEGNKYLESYGIDTKNLYVAMRRRTSEAIEKNEGKAQFDGAYRLMDKILAAQR